MSRRRPPEWYSLARRWHDPASIVTLRRANSCRRQTASVAWFVVRWDEVRKAFPSRWLVIEALEAHSAEHRRVFDRVAVIETCPDGRTSMKRYGELRRAHPGREFCFVHTDMTDLDIVERRWVGVRGRDKTDSS